MNYFWEVGDDGLQVEQNEARWSYDPREGYAVDNPSLVEDHGIYECHATSTKNRTQSVTYWLEVKRKFKWALKPLTFINF